MHERPIKYTRRALFGLGLVAGGAILEASIPGGVVRRGIDVMGKPSTAEIREDYLSDLNSRGVIVLVHDINAQREKIGLSALNLDPVLSLISRNVAESAAQIPSFGDSRLRISASQVKPLLDEIDSFAGGSGLSENSYKNVIVAADSVIGIGTTTRAIVRNNNELLYSFTDDDVVPITPIFQEKDINKVGAGVALDEAGNRIVFIVAATKQ